MRFSWFIRFGFQTLSVVLFLIGGHTVEAGDLAKRSPLALYEIIQQDGIVMLEQFGAQMFGGQVQILVSPSLHPHFRITQNDKRMVIATGDAFWDTQVEVNGIRCQARTMAAQNGQVYVLSQFDAPHLDTQVVGILKWDVASGIWNVLGEVRPTDHPTTLLNR